MTPKTEISNRYKVYSTLLGEGKKGKVYLGKDTKKRKKVAVKIIPVVKKGLREASVMESYGRNKFLPKIYFQTIHNKNVYIIMEYIDGLTLKKFKRKKKTIKEKKAVVITLNILRGLHHLHNSGYYHNDLHPNNVMIKQNRPSTLKLIDFSGSSEEKNRKKEDLYRASCLLLYLSRKDGCGYSSNPELTFNLENKRLNGILLKGLKKQYKTSQEYIRVLQTWLKEE